MKHKISKIIFYLSFLPLVAYVIVSIYALIKGVPFTYSELPGVRGFILVTLKFSKYAAVFAACLIYQTVYFYKTHSKNMVWCCVLAAIFTVTAGYITLASDNMYDSYVENVYQIKPYADPCVFVLEYDESYKDVVDTEIRIRYEEMFAYVYTTYGDEALEQMWKYRGNMTSYAITTSPIIDGEPIVNDNNVEIGVCEGHKDLRISVDYEIKKSDKQYIIVCVTDSALDDAYTLSSKWSALKKMMFRSILTVYC